MEVVVGSGAKAIRILVGQAGKVETVGGRTGRHLLCALAQAVLRRHLGAGVEKGHDGVDANARVVSNHNKTLAGLDRKLHPILIVGRLEAMGLAHPISGDVAGVATAVVRFKGIGDAGAATQGKAVGAQRP